MCVHAQPEQQQLRTPPSDDLSGDLLTEATTAIEDADLHVAKAARRAKQSRTVPRAVDGSAEFADGLAEVAVAIAAEVVRMITP
jgi:hypothetical protein